MVLIKRGNEPGAGLWSLPGGRIEAGETDEQALVREILEETGLSVTPGRLLGAVQRPVRDGAVADIRDYVAVVTGGSLRAGDDAADARWVTKDEMRRMQAAGRLTPGLTQALASWGVLDHQ
jgi:ADP-ribose pyrophosphatase YjhB (NUDIX family)